jgi:uncharacterized membrane protein YuzA (DUF378 family)
MALVKKIYAAAIFLLVLGGMAWGYMGMKGKNPVAQALGKYAWIVYGLVGLSAIVVLATGRNAYLPFLGPMVFPSALLQDKVPDNADTTVEIQTRPGVKVLYWGAEPAAEPMKALKSWKEAYGHYENVGVATADAEGKAVLRLRKPQAYKVPLKGRLESHVHYRICLADGWLSQVETHILHSEAFVDIQPEGFQNPTPPVIPVVASSPEQPVIADPVSGLPTAVPADVVTMNAPPQVAQPVAGAESPAVLEGFSNEPMYSTASDDGSALGKTDEEDPRLIQLRSVVEADSLKVMDDMGYPEGVGSMGTDLDAAFAPSLKFIGPPAQVWSM